MAVARKYVEKSFYTEAEYFAFDEKTLGHWEYVDGQILAMAGGSDDHNLILTNIVAALAATLRPRGCRVYGSDMKVACGDGTITYPDVSAVCGPRRYRAGRTDTYTNPLLVVEVLSNSTAGYDQDAKFGHYQTIPDLEDYLIVSQHEARVTLHTRKGDRWASQEVSGVGAVIPLPSVETTLTLKDIYALIELT